MKKLAILALVSALSITNQAHAASPFGMEIGVMSEAKLKEDFKVTHTGVSSWTDGAIYDISTPQLDFQGLQKATAIFNENQVLVGLLLNFPKNKFDALEGYVADNFELKARNIPFVGDKSATYFEADTEVRLAAPHMGFEMSMNFLDGELIQAFEAGKKKQNKAKSDGEKAALFGK